MFADWGIHTPWAAFVTTLVIWAYAWASASATDRLFLPGQGEDQKNKCNALLEQILAQSGRPDSLEAGIGDLLVVIAERLEVREELARENGRLLLGLCGKNRLIG